MKNPLTHRGVGGPPERAHRRAASWTVPMPVAPTLLLAMISIAAPWMRCVVDVLRRAHPAPAYAFPREGLWARESRNFRVSSV